MIHNLEYDNILSIDSSLDHNIIAILYNNTIHYQINECNKQHEKNILTMIHVLLIKNKLKINNFKIISFTIGPGSFTGIRLSTSIAQGLSIPNNIHLIGISTLKILAEQTWRLYKFDKIIVCNIANKKNIYWGQYIKKNNYWVGSEISLTIDIAYQKINSLTEIWYMVGSGHIYFKNIKNQFLRIIRINTPYAEDMITLTRIEAKKKNFLLLENIHLNYLNNPIY
ncbi:tRNA (adenosine(37)-N6)-threonylcarbamoyltransferase complex dimerization subunit type 1 TsaB [Buchnera aphidicola (Takecallis taiwana)]|uniref:tRNA (adenosine(37)-N6)-threonylcarbamoyltransferase complex dimerization subunit type 1 TsaB n=1 Tax=Buchnera aphidicola TaxID=9 RepID=UPI0031B6E3F8